MVKLTRKVRSFINIEPFVSYITYLCKMTIELFSKSFFYSKVVKIIYLFFSILGQTKVLLKLNKFNNFQYLLEIST